MSQISSPPAAPLHILFPLSPPFPPVGLVAAASRCPVRSSLHRRGAAARRRQQGRPNQGGQDPSSHGRLRGSLHHSGPVSAGEERHLLCVCLSVVMAWYCADMIISRYCFTCCQD